MAFLGGAVPIFMKGVISAPVRLLKTRSVKENQPNSWLGLIRTFKKNHRPIRLTFWSFALIWVGATVLFLLEYDHFRESVSNQLSIIDDAKQNPDNPMVEMESQSDDHQSKKRREIGFFSTYLHTIWWSVTTFTTVGYGDISPKSEVGKAFGIVVMLGGFVWAMVLSGSLASVLVAKRLKEDEDEFDESIFVDHTIISGWNHMVAPILSVLSREKETVPIVLVNEISLDDVRIQSAISGFDNLDILHVFGNYTNEVVLSKAFIQRAKNMIVLPDYAHLSQLESPDEQTTVLAVYTAKAMSEDLRVIAHITNPEMTAHLQRANCDEIVVSDAFTPKMLAYHITHPGSPQMVETIFSPQNRSDLQVHQIPPILAGAEHHRIYQHFKHENSWLLVGYAIVRPADSLEEQMKNAGNTYVLDMIKEQLEREGIDLTSDEKVFIEVNPRDDYMTDETHRAIVLI